MNITDASPIDDHILRAINSDFCLPNEIPLPPDSARSIDIVPESDPKALRAWRGLQLDRVKGIVNSATDFQAIWISAAPTSIKSATERLQTVALTTLLQTFDLGGRLGLSSSPAVSR